MRWQFPDYADRAESLERQARVECIDRWWATFARQADAVDAHFDRAGEADVMALMTELDTVDPTFGWEFGRAVAKQGHRLCLSTEGHDRLRPLLDVVLARAPRLPRWEFHAGRLAEPFAEFRGGIDSRTTTPGVGVVATVTPGHANRIDVRYHFPRAAWPGDPKEAQKFAFYTTQRLLGEDRLDRWIGDIEATLDSPVDEPLLLERLAETVEATVCAVVADLPAEPRHRHRPGVGQKGAVFRLTAAATGPEAAGWSDLAFASTPDPDLWRGTHSRRFFSGRYSRHGETFAYLKLDGLGGLKGRVADRGRIEEPLSAALADAGLGCTVGGGTGHVYSYIDLALTDVEAAVAVIRSTLRGLDVDRRSWLLFFDAEYADEWLGVWPETPRPPRA